MNQPQAIEPSTVLHVNRRLPQRDLLGHRVFVHPGRRETVTLDEVATWLLAQVDGSTSVDLIAQRCAETYDVTVERAIEDALELFAGLAQVGLVQVSPS